MRASVRNLLLVASLELVAVSAAAAQQGIYLPPAPHGPGGEDTIETASGTRCRQSINSNSGYVDIGVAGSGGSGIPNASGVFFWVWTLLALQVTAMVSLVLSINGLWRLRRRRA